MTRLLAALLAAIIAIPAIARTPLEADLTLYATPGGSSGNDCLSPATACTPLRAWTRIRDELDLRCRRVMVLLADGFYSHLDLVGTLTGACSTDAVTLRGNLAHPDRASITGLDANAITVHEGAWLKLEGLQLTSVKSQSFNSGGHGLVVYRGGRVILGTMAFHVCDFSHIDVAEGSEIHAEGAFLYMTGTTEIFALAEDGGKLWLNGAWITTLVANTFTNGMFHSSRGAMIDLSGTILNQLGGPLHGITAIAESNSLIILLGMVLPPTMWPPHTDHGGQVLR